MIIKVIRYFVDLLNINTTINYSKPMVESGYSDLISMLIAQVLGVLIGGGITYWATKRLNERTDRKQREYQRRDNLYSPLCTLIENVKDASHGTDPGDFDQIDSSNIDGKAWNELRTAASRYLRAEYRKHLTTKDMEEIVNLKGLLSLNETMISEQEIEGREVINRLVVHEISKQVTTFLKSKFKIDGIIEPFVFDNSKMRRFITLGSVGTINISYCEFYIYLNGMQKKIYCDCEDQELIKLANISNSEYDGRYGDETRIKIFVYKQVMLAAKSIACNLHSEFNEYIVNSHDELIERETEILNLLDAIYNRLISEIDRITVM